MSDWVRDINGMHTKFGVHQVVRGFDPERLAAFLKFRLDFLQEELTEAQEARHKTGHHSGGDDLVDALIDLCVVAIGTLDLLDVDAQEAWQRVLQANLAKEVGVKPGRPNPLGLPDLVKPEGWTAPTHADNVGALAALFPPKPEDELTVAVRRAWVAARHMHVGEIEGLKAGLRVAAEGAAPADNIWLAEAYAALTQIDLSHGQRPKRIPYTHRSGAVAHVVASSVRDALEQLRRQGAAVEGGHLVAG